MTDPTATAGATATGARAATDGRPTTDPVATTGASATAGAASSAAATGGLESSDARTIPTTTGARTAPTTGGPTPARAASATPATRHVPGTGAGHRHILVAVVNNRPGVLNRVASLMRARNFNIDSLAVGHTERDDISRMTITLHGDDVAVEQAAKQLYKLIDVLKVQDVTNEPRIEHELALIKVRATNSTRAEVLKIVELYKGRVVDVAADSVIVEATGTEDEIDALVALVGGFGIREMVRTGTTVMVRGPQVVEYEGAGK